MLPPLLQQRLARILGSHYDRVYHAFEHERIGSFRINTLQSSAAEVLSELEKK